MTRYREREHCDGCNRLLPVNDMTEVAKLECRQTYSSPAEYSDVLVCDDCFSGDGPDEDYERAERSEAWQRRGGGGL